MHSSSNVLVIGPHRPRRMDFGADYVDSFAQAEGRLRGTHKPAVVVFGKGRGHELDKFCNFARTHAPDTLWIVDCEGLPPSQLMAWSNEGRLHGLIEGPDDPYLEDALKSALELSGERSQRRQLVELFEDQSARLKRLSAELESRVQKRHKTLSKSLRTLEETKARMEAFHRALLGIHRASTVLQMEQSLNESLRGSVDIEWVRVRFESQSSLARQSGSHLLAIELPFRFDGLRGEAVFAKADGKSFSADESDFLFELSEALALALSRLQKLEQAEVLKGQWQATFDSIPHPLCVTSNDFEILKLNKAFQQFCASRPFHGLLGKNSFRVFFGEDFRPPSPLECPFTFRQARMLESATEHFEVTGQPLGFSRDNQTVQLILLRPITDEVRYERRILDASKLAELGTIGSSIAHELNNPLGGMLSFLQLILIDLDRASEHHADIKAMEEAVLRCRDIVQNLLSFARKQDLGDFETVDLNDVTGKAVKLIELQTKSKGIDIRFPERRGLMIRASSNALAQAFCHILQNSIDAIQDMLAQDPLYPGKIAIEFTEQEDSFVLRISDNGTGIRPEILSQIFNPLFTTRDPRTFNGMGLTTSFTIVTDHGGKLEILSQTGAGTTAVIALPKLAPGPS
jgi:signal transduction histidine kinase